MDVDENSTFLANQQPARTVHRRAGMKVSVATIVVAAALSVLGCSAADDRLEAAGEEVGTVQSALVTPTIYYHNGPILDRPKVFAVLWGTFTADEKNKIGAYLTGFTGYLSNVGANEPTLRQYGVVSASYTGSYNDTSVPTDANNDTTISNKIASLQTAGNVPAYDSETMILVVAKSTAPSGCGGFQPRHRTAGSGKYWGFTVYDAVGDGTNTCRGGVTRQTYFETLVSHEMQECFTDPDTSTGWRSDGGECDQNCEVNDVTGVQFSATCNGPTNYMVTFPNGTTGGVAYTWNRMSNSCAYTVPKQSEDAFAWAGAEDMGASMTGSPGVALSSWGPGRLDLWATGTDKVVYHRACSGACTGAAWSGWDNIGGTLVSKPAVVSWGPNRIDVFGLDAAGLVQHKAYDNGTWSGWDQGLGGDAGNRDIAVSSDGPGHLTVWRLRTDGRVDLNNYTGVWGGWQSVPNSAAATGNNAGTRLNATSWGTARHDLLAYNFSTGLLAHDSLLTSGFTPWDTIPADPTGACGHEGATIAARGWGKLLVLCSQSGWGNLRGTTFDTVGNWSSWSPWRENYGGAVTLRVGAAVSWNGARTDALLVNTAGQLFHTYTL